MKTALSLLTFAILTSCQAKNDADPNSALSGEMAGAGEKEKAPPAIDVSKPETLVGLPHADVKAACDAAGVRNRIIELDGASQPVTRDFRPDRLNFKVNGGKITEVSKG